MSMMREYQVSVPMDEALRRFLEEAAAREHRTVAGQVRFLVAEAARQESERAGVRP